MTLIHLENFLIEICPCVVVILTIDCDYSDPVQRRYVHRPRGSHIELDLALVLFMIFASTYLKLGSACLTTEGVNDRGIRLCRLTSISATAS